METTTYQVTRFNGDWGDVPPARIAAYPWACPYRPQASARLAHTGGAFVWRAEAAEPRGHMRAAERGVTRLAHEDSCMEFFLQPAPKTDARYFNWEVTAGGAMNVGFGAGRHDRLRFTAEQLADFTIEPFEEQTPDGLIRWGFTARLTYAFIKRHAPDFNPAPDYAMRGNFMKCGDKTKAAHYGMWSPGKTPAPDFHQPSTFGDFILID